MYKRPWDYPTANFFEEEKVRLLKRIRAHEAIVLSQDSEEPPGSDVPKSDEEPPPGHALVPEKGPFTGAEFRDRFFPHISQSLWEDWRWQFKHRIRTIKALEKILGLSPEEALLKKEEIFRLPIAITPYYLSLIYDKPQDHPLRRCMVPTKFELIPREGESEDPLMENDQSPVPGIVHRYPDRVLFLVTPFCFTYCRYCTRSRVVGRNRGLGGKSYLKRAISYIEANPSIRDVVISGGDPLTLSDEVLEWLLSRLRAIRHVEIIRIGTKAPAVLPQRITEDLTKVLKRFHPLYMSIHFTHPEELTPEVEVATSRLADAGIPLGSQTVLLKGINDDLETLKRLFTRLLYMRVRPYYLYQCDPIVGSSHFRTKVERGIELMKGLRGFISGYGIPTYVIDAPGGGGKVPVDLGSLVAIQDSKVVLKNYQGMYYEYPNSD